MRLQIGYVPLCDAAPVIVAHELGFAREEGLALDLAAEPSWATLRDRLALGHLDAAHMLAPLALASALGLSGPPAALRVPLGRAPQGPVVCIVSGGNNDVSRYGEVVERSLLHEGLRNYFLVTFPQEPGALRHFLDEVLGPGDDIVLFEYVKKNNRETGPALVGIELELAADLAGLLERMEASPLTIEQVPPGSPLFTFLL